MTSQYKRGENPRSLANLGKQKTKAGRFNFSLSATSAEWLSRQANKSAAIDQLIIEEIRREKMVLASVETFINGGYQPKFDLVSLKAGVFNEETGWTWVLRFADGREVEYRTNAKYEGLYAWYGEQWQQQSGNGQFSLPRDREKAIAVICKRFGDEFSRRTL